MFHNRYNYWSCSKIADFIRNTKKPSSGSSEEWRIWKKACKKTHPLRFWIAEELLDKIQNFIYYPYDICRDIESFCSNYFVSHPNQLRAHKNHIKPWQWVDVSERILPCMFDTLVNFVEVEQAYLNYGCLEKNDRKKYKWKNGRCKEAGLDSLKWAASLTYDENYGVSPEDKMYGKPTRQATDAIEILDLYHWWTEVYSKRIDPMDASGWSEFCSRKRNDNNDDSDELSFLDENKNLERRKESKSISTKLHKLEKQYEDEDTKMLIRLIKIRNGLWT